MSVSGRRRAAQREARREAFRGPSGQLTGSAPLVLDHPERVGLLAAELVIDRLRARPGARVILPTGRTPAGMYAALRAHAADGALPTAGATLFQLDEYVGVGAGDPRSFTATLRRELAGVDFAAFHGLDGASPDPDGEAARHQRLLDEAPVDLAVLGLGRDGHVAFDEPGSPPGSGARRVTLDERTRRDAADAFCSLARVPTEAITVGLRTLLAARRLVLLVTGGAKAPALKAMLEGPRTTECPASLLRDHPRLTVVCDRAAAALLHQRPGFRSDRAVVVLGPERLRRAAQLVRRAPARAAILTGWTPTDGLSEAEQMLAAWNGPEVPALLEGSGRGTAENASRALPLLWAMGDVRNIIVVTSVWRLRAPFFFAPYRRYGFDLSFWPALERGDWARMLGAELAGALTAADQREEAFAAIRLPPEPTGEVAAAA